MKNPNNEQCDMCCLTILKDHNARFDSWKSDETSIKSEVLELLEKKKNLELENEDSETSETRKQEIAEEIEQLILLAFEKNENYYVFEV